MTKSPRLWATLFCVLGSLGVSSCSGRSAGDSGHRAALSPSSGNSSPGFMNPDASLAPIAAAQPEKAEDIYTVSIQPLRAEFFQAENLMRSELAGSERDRLLRRYNELVLNFVSNVGVEDTRRGELLAEYEAMVLTGCDRPNYSTCRLVPFFRRSANSYDVWLQVMKTPARSLDQERERIRIGFRLQNERLNPSVSIAYLGIAPRMETVIAETRDRELENQHYTMVERILSRSRGFDQSPEYRSYVRSLLERPAGSGGLEERRRRLQSTLMAIEVPKGLFREEWFLQALRSNYVSSPIGYFAHLNRLKRQKPNTLKNFDIQEIVDLDPSFFLVENVFNGTWSAVMARDYFAGSQIDRAAMLERIRQFSKAVVLSTIVDSNHSMGEVFADPTNFRSSDLHMRAIDKGRELQSRWIYLYGQMARVRDLAKLIYGSESQEYLGLRITQDDLNETSVYTVSYPFMLMIAYQMTVYRFSIQGWFSRIEHYRVLEIFFAGQLGDVWFDFTQDAKRGIRDFKPTDLLYSFHFALRAETFESFDIQPDGFVREISQALLRGALERVRQSYKLFTDPQSAYATDWQRVQTFCREERQIANHINPAGLPKQARSMKFEVPIDAIPRGILGETSFGRAFLDTSDRIQNDFETSLAAKLKFWTNVHEEGIEVLRVGLRSRIVYIEDMVHVLRQHLLKQRTQNGVVSDASRAEVEQKIQSASAVLRLAEHEQRRYVGTVFPMFRNVIFPCSTYMVRWEFDLHNIMVEMDLEYLKQIYRDYHTLQRLKQQHGIDDINSTQNPEVLAVLEKYRIRGFENQDYTGLDRFRLNEGFFEAYAIDAQFRYARFFKEGLVTDTYRREPLVPELEIKYPVRGLRDVEAFQPTGRIPFQFSIARAQNEDDFARAAIRTIHGNGNHVRLGALAFFHISSYSIGRSLPPDLLNIFMVLMRLDEVDGYDPAQPQCFTDTPASGCEVKKYKMENSELHDLIYPLWDIAAGNQRDWQALDTIGRLSRGYRGNVAMTVGGTNADMGWGQAFLFNPMNLDPLAFFDVPYALSRSTRLGFQRKLPWDVPTGMGGSGNDPDRGQLLPIDRAMQIYDARVQERFFLFGVDREMGDFLVDSAKSRMEREFEMPRRVAAVARGDEARDRERNFVREYRVRVLRSEWTRGFYLNPVYEEDQASVEDEFHQRTANIFRISR